MSNTQYYSHVSYKYANRIFLQQQNAFNKKSIFTIKRKFSGKTIQKVKKLTERHHIWFITRLRNPFSFGIGGDLRIHKLLYRFGNMCEQDVNVLDWNF